MSKILLTYCGVYCKLCFYGGRIELKTEETMGVGAGKTYVLNQDIKMDSQLYRNKISYCGKKGQEVIVLHYSDELCLVESIDHKFYVRPDQLDDKPINPTKEETMIKYTLQEVIELYKNNNGGRFRKKAVDGFPLTVPFQWFVLLPNGFFVSEDSGKRIELHFDFFNTVWIYEPPKQSAFQKLHNKKDTCQCGACSKIRKETWNDAIDEAVLIAVISTDPKETLAKIKGLREGEK